MFIVIKSIIGNYGEINDIDVILGENVSNVNVNYI